LELQDNRQLTFNGCYFASQRNCLINGLGDRISIRPKALAVFKHLSKYPGKIVSKEELLGQIWSDVIVTDDAVGKCIAEIRRAIKDKDRSTLQTISGSGYLLEPDGESNQQLEEKVAKATNLLPEKLRTISNNARLIIAVLTVGILAIAWAGFESEIGAQSIESDAGTLGLDSESGTPTVAIIIDEPASSSSNFIQMVEKNTRIALSRYRSVALVESDSADFNLFLSQDESVNPAEISIVFVRSDNNQTIFAENLVDESLTALESVSVDSPAMSPEKSMGVRIAAMIASPGGGVVSRYLVSSANEKTVDELTPAECYAYGYDCTNCSGELDQITEKAEACLTNILEKNPEDARAWGLKSTIIAHQYQWSTSLAEPQRTNLSARSHLKELAIIAASKAEQFSDGEDTSVYWGMAQAYGASCEIDKLKTAIDRGLQINPDDPSLLGAFGGWLAYAGKWGVGVEMVERALQLEPRFYKRWWLFAIAKQYYAKGEYQSALRVFRKAYNENNWLSHLQLAYTLPYLGQLDEAVKERMAFERLYPGATIESVIQFYSLYCFEDSFLDKMKWALTQAGLPSRGSLENFSEIQPPAATVKSLNGYDIEYMDIGAGVPIVFVHGSISDYRAWSHFQNPISENHRFISYSRRYSGSQPWPDSGESFGIRTDIDDLIAFVEMLDIGPVFTVSWSRGGRVTGPAAVERPDLFQGAIHFEPIANSLGNSTDKSVLAARSAFFNRFKESTALMAENKPEKAVAAILENVFELERGRFDLEIMPIRLMNRDSARAMSLQLEKDAAAEPIATCELLGNSTIPTLVIGGSLTNAWWKHVVQRFHECIPNSEFKMLDNVNHDGPIRQPSAMSEMIIEFVDRYTL